MKKDGFFTLLIKRFKKTDKSEKTSVSRKKVLWMLFWNFVKISSVSVGGGLTMIPLIEKYFTPPHGDLTHDDIVDTVAFGQSMPGIIAVNMSGFIGMRVAGIAGAVMASFGVVIVPFLLIMGIAAVMNRISGPVMDAAFAGVRAGVSALILNSAIKMSKNICKSKLAVILTVVSFLLLIFTGVNLIYVIIGGGVIGAASVFISVLNARKKGVERS